MLTVSKHDGQIAFDLKEFCKNYGHPAGRVFNFEVTHKCGNLRLCGTHRHGLC
jgi:hypothetical protein